MTRPQQDAASWVGELQVAGFSAASFPLLELSELMTAQDADQALAQVLQSQVVMFVSANAVRFLASAMDNKSAWLAHFKHAARAWCTGPGTAAALLACGIPASQIDQPPAHAAQLDSEALWEVVSPQVSAGMHVLFVRGANQSGAVVGRDWLTQQLDGKNAQVQAIAAYRRVPANLSAGQLAQVDDFIAQGAIWLFSSSAAIESLAAQCPNIDWATVKAVVTHPRMAQMLEIWGCRQLSIASPGIPAMLSSIKSLA